MTFDTIIDRVLSHEGGYVNDPDDPGGETQWGISKRAYPHLIIKDISRPQAVGIYRRDFWKRINGESLPPAVGYQLLDFAINSGIETAVRYFQRALGVADDGHWGPVSESAAASMSQTDMIFGLNAERLEYMTKLKNWPAHSRGWARRIATNLRYGRQDT